MNYNFSGQEIGQEFCDLIKTNITISMRTAFIFSSNMTMISYFNIIINIIIITNPTLKLSLSALVIKFFYFLTTKFIFFDRSNINKNFELHLCHSMF